MPGTVGSFGSPGLTGLGVLEQSGQGSQGWIGFAAAGVAETTNSRAVARKRFIGLLSRGGIGRSRSR